MDLFSLLAQFEKGSFSRGRDKELGNPIEGSTIIFGDLRGLICEETGLMIGTGSNSRETGCSGCARVAESSEAVEVLLGRMILMSGLRMLSPIVLMMFLLEWEVGGHPEKVRVRTDKVREIW